MINVDELRRLSRAERTELACALAALDTSPADDAPADDAAAGPQQPSPLTESDLPGSPRSRAIALVAVIGCGLLLAAWIGVLAVTLPRYYRSGGWRGAWVGFDLGLLVTFAITAWAGWRHRQLVIICLVVLATLLCCDAWFDVTLDLRTSDFLVSVLMALCVELPLAALAVIGARRLMRLNIRTAGRLAGRPGRVPPLWKIPLYSMESRGFRTLIPAGPCPPGDPGDPGEPLAPAGQRVPGEELSPGDQGGPDVLVPSDQGGPPRRAAAGVD